MQRLPLLFLCLLSSILYPLRSLAQPILRGPLTTNTAAVQLTTLTNAATNAVVLAAGHGATIDTNLTPARITYTIRGTTLSSNDVQIGEVTNLNFVATGGTNSLVQIGVTNGNATLQINATSSSGGSSNYPVIAAGTIDNTNLATMGAVQIRSNLTASSLTATNPSIIGNTNAAAPVLPNTVLRMLNVDAAPARFGIESYNAADVNGSFITGYRIRGTKASPGVVVSNDVLLALSGNGWQGTMWTNSNALIALKSETNFTAQNQPTFIQFFTTKRGATNPVEALRIQPNGTTLASNLAQQPFIPATDGTGSGEQRVAWRLGVLTNSVTVTNTTADTSCITNALLGSQTIPANTLWPGSTVRITLRGKMTSASATPTTFGVRSNNGLLLGTNIAALATTLVNDGFTMEGFLSIRSIGASGSAVFYGAVGYQSSSGAVTSALARRMLNGVFATAITLDTTTAIVIDPFVDPGATTHGFTAEICTIEILP